MGERARGEGEAIVRGEGGLRRRGTREMALAGSRKSIEDEGEECAGGRDEETLVRALHPAGLAQEEQDAGQNAADICAHVRESATRLTSHVYTFCNLERTRG